MDKLLSSLASSDTEQLRKKVELLTWLAERDLTPSTPGMSRVPSEALGIAYRLTDDPGQWDVIPRVCEYFISHYPTEDYPKSYCRGLIKSIENNRKSRSVAEAQKQWDEDQAHDAKLDPDDWRVALVKNNAGMRKLLALYASKVKGK